MLLGPMEQSDLTVPSVRSDGGPSLALQVQVMHVLTSAVENAFSTSAQHDVLGSSLCQQKWK